VKPKPTPESTPKESQLTTPADAPTIFYDRMPSTVGEILLVATNKGLAGVAFLEADTQDSLGARDEHTQQLPERALLRRELPARLKNRSLRHDPQALQPARAWLERYFSKDPVAIDDLQMPRDPGGTDFQRSVWEALTKIPYGLTTSYGQIAQAVGEPGAARAVGLANNRYPIAIIVPCHRVVGADGKLVGYASGVWRKDALLRLEGGDLFDALDDAENESTKPTTA